MFPRYTCIDIEMTGLKLRSDRIVSFGAYEMQGAEMTGRHIYFIVNPDCPIPLKTQKIHGISNQDVADKPFFPEVAPAIIDFLGEDPIVIHSGIFQHNGRAVDESFLNKELELAGYPLVAQDRFINQVFMANELFKNRKLDDVLDHYKVDRTLRKKFHEAKLDAYLLAQLYPQLWEDYQAYAQEKKPIAEPVTNQFQDALRELALRMG